MRKKVLIIEDDEDQFLQLKNWLRKKGYTALPNNYNEMGDHMISTYKLGESDSLENYVIGLIKDNYKDIGLILSDIYFYDDERGGNKLIQAIRDYKGINPSNWTSNVPIFAVTIFSSRQEAIIADGADFTILKDDIYKDDGRFSMLIEAHMKRFEDRIKSSYPSDIRSAISKFKDDHHDHKTAFIMTSFQEHHLEIANTIKSILDEKKIKGCLASDKEYIANTWENIQVYLHGCDFGIGIYADDSIIPTKPDVKIDEESFKRIRINPNMSLEVGYMLSLQKKVCILKKEDDLDIPADLAGKLYRKFTKSNYDNLINWLRDNDFISH